MKSSGCLRSDGGDEPPPSIEEPALDLDLLAAAAAASGEGECEGAGEGDVSAPIPRDEFPCGGTVPEMFPMTACLAAGGSSLDPPPRAAAAAAPLLLSPR